MRGRRHRPTLKVLRTIVHACSVGLAGEEDEGDWQGVSAEELEQAREWAHEAIRRRERELARHKKPKATS